MYGAILGDIIGSPYEWHNIKTKDFPLFRRRSHFTDDSVMTIAVADALMKLKENTPDVFTDMDDEKRERISAEVARSLKLYGNLHPDAGYGGSFRRWLREGEGPYFSWGNGSAMRTSPAGWLFEDMDTVRAVAGIQAAVTHNHPEGIKGAEAVASAIFMARKGKTKDEIRDYITGEFGYDFSKTCDEIRLYYEFDVSCQGSIPQAITAFLEGKDFEDVVRTAVSLGGDSDTIAAMAGSIAEAYYGIPDELIMKLDEYLTEDLAEVTEKFREYL